MADLTSSQVVPADALPKMNKRDLLARYRDRVKGAQRWREHEGYDDVWKRMRDVYRLRSLNAQSHEDQVLVAIAFATINVIEPSVAINQPHITVTANTEETADQATIAEAVINYLWRHFNFQPEVRRAVKDMLVYGHGWIKVGWRHEVVDVPIPEETINQQFMQQSQQADAYAANNPDQAHLLPSDGDIYQSIPKKQPQTTHDEAYLLRVSPFDIFVDPEATTEYDYNWIAQRTTRGIEDVKADARYSKTARDKLSGDRTATWAKELNKVQSDQDEGRVTLWEFYDIQRNIVCVFAEGSDDYLIAPKPIPYNYGAPFVMFRDYNVADQFYPMGEIEALEPLQNELNETRSAMVRARKTSIRKFMVHKNDLDERMITDLKNDKDNTVIIVDSDKPLADVIAPIQGNTIQPELFNHSKTILDDFDRVSAVSDYQRGELPEIRRTATEANIIQSASNARAADKLAVVELAIAQVARRVLMLMQQFMSSEQAARITGPTGQTKWFNYSSMDIQGEFDFMVEAGSTQPKDDNFRRQRAIQMAQAMEPFVTMQIVDPHAIAFQLLKDGFDVKDPTKFFAAPQQGPSPQVKMIETMAYKDVPPDIQRQIETAAGFQPSAYGALPVDHVGKVVADAHQQAAGQVQTAQDQAHGDQQAQADRQHQMDMAKQTAKAKPPAAKPKGK